MTHYYSGRSGDSFTDATLHTDAECCPGPVRPLAESTAESLTDTNYCPDCAGGDDEPEEPEQNRDVAQLIELGSCPWCEKDGFESVGRHASAAHPNEWQDYRDD